MPLVRRENPVPPPHPSHSLLLEDILRDAAVLDAYQDAPGGLAHRALARQIASQSVQKQSRSIRSRALWLGGLSAGTFAGAAAAILIMAHLNGNIFQIAPTTAVLSVPVTPALLEHAAGTAHTAATCPAIRRELPEARPQTAAVTRASMIPVTQLAAEPRPSAQPIVQPQEASVKAPSRDRMTRSVRSAQNAPPGAVPPVAHWKTENVEETSYQLITTAYVTSPENDSSGSNTGEDLVPVQMRVGFEPTALPSPSASPMPKQKIESGEIR